MQRQVEPARQTRKLARCQDHLNENQELEVAIFLYRECGLAKVVDEHDIAIDVVYLRVENPASIGRNRQAPFMVLKSRSTSIIFRTCRVVPLYVA